MYLSKSENVLFVKFYIVVGEFLYDNIVILLMFMQYTKTVHSAQLKQCTVIDEILTEFLKF